MIITHGDVLNTDCWIIAHQVNCQGVMGGGLARQIKDRYPDAYINYREYIEDYKECNGTVPLGTILETRRGTAQEKYGTFLGKSSTEQINNIQIMRLLKQLSKQG